jgi:DhnA family fructose-bisphosphate aldolase class Ia
MQEIGVNKKLKRIFSHSSGKAVITPIDDSLLAGAINGLENMKVKIGQIISESPNAIIAFQGTIRHYADIIGNVPTILNLTASTTNIHHTRKNLISTIELAIQLGVEAVAVHVNLSSIYEHEMLTILGKVSADCHRYGIPLMAIMYPRKENADGSDNNYYELKENNNAEYTNLVAHAARVGMELGADMIKTQYTGNVESFKKVVNACAPVPVVIAGGFPIEIDKLLDVAEGVVKAGGTGISFGRNIYTRENPSPYIQAMKDIILDSMPKKEALEKFKKYHER